MMYQNHILVHLQHVGEVQLIITHYIDYKQHIYEKLQQIHNIAYHATNGLTPQRLDLSAITSLTLVGKVPGKPLAVKQQSTSLNNVI